MEDKDRGGWRILWMFIYLGVCNDVWCVVFFVVWVCGLVLGWVACRVVVLVVVVGRSGWWVFFGCGLVRLGWVVGLGKVGIVLMLEASRLARNISDW